MEYQLVVLLSMLLRALLFPCLAVSQPVPEPDVTVRVSPDNTGVQRNGSTVSLLCQISGFNANIHVVTWYIVNDGIYINSDSLYVEDERFSISFDLGEIVTFNLTISPVSLLTDSGSYRCILNANENGTSNFVAVQRDELVLTVYPKDAFPVCDPIDEATVSLGSALDCQTSGASAPVIVDGNSDNWLYRMLQNGQAGVRRKYVTSSDNGKTYVCSAWTASDVMSLSCNIGPLTVINNKSTWLLTTGPPDEVTFGLATVQVTTSSTITIRSLSTAEISGIVVGAIAVLVIAVLVLILCCQCNQRQWFPTNPYHQGGGKSLETHRDRDDTARGASDAAMISGERPFSSDQAEQSADVYLTHGGDLNRSESQGGSNVYAESLARSNKSDMDFGLRPDLNIAVYGANINNEGPNPPDKETTDTTQMKALDNSNNTPDTTKRHLSWKEGASVPAGATANPVQPLLVERELKKYARDDKVSDKEKAVTSQTVIYADLDMVDNVQGKRIQSDESKTLYADIKI